MAWRGPQDTSHQPPQPQLQRNKLAEVAEPAQVAVPAEVAVHVGEADGRGGEAGPLLVFPDTR